MEAQRIIDQLTAEFPGSAVKCIPPHEPLEIIVELPGTSEEGLAIAVIDRSVPHLHRMTTETYEIQEGVLQVHVARETLALQAGEAITIQPRQVIWAEGQATRLLVRSRPPWTQGDHVIRE